jgi:hypothetical protein
MGIGHDRRGGCAGIGDLHADRGAPATLAFWD